MSPAAISTSQSSTARFGGNPREAGSNRERAVDSRASPPSSSVPTSSLRASSGVVAHAVDQSLSSSRGHGSHRAGDRAVVVDGRATAASSTQPRQALRANDDVQPRDPFDHPVFKQMTFPAQIQYVGNESVVYQNVRSLQGVVRSSAHPVIETSRVPSCGPALDHFLQAMGYDLNAKLAISQALRDARELVDFVRGVVHQGIPVLEARYMWALYRSEPPVARWAEHYIM